MGAKVRKNKYKGVELRAKQETEINLIKNDCCSNYYAIIV